MEKVLFILSELDDDDIDWILETGKRKELPIGTVLIQQGQPIDAIYILLEGQLSVTTMAAQGREIATLFTGEVVGEMSFIDARPPSATVTAKTEAIVLCLSRSLLAIKLKQDVGFASRFYRALAVFLSERLRLAVHLIGNSNPEPLRLADGGLTPAAKARVAIAQTRLDWLLRRLKD
jgi:CRP/FNR family transcriptional regulator, cyclic AMP receptor protein